MRAPQARREQGFDDVFAGARRITLAWPGLAAEYAWLPPHQGVGPTTANTLQVVFSSNTGVAMEYDRTVHDLVVAPGVLYVAGAEPTFLLNVNERSEVLKMLVEPELLRAAAEREGIRHSELEPSLSRRGTVTLPRDPVALAVAHVLRRACMKQAVLSDIEASHLTHILVRRVLFNQYGVAGGREHPAPRLSDQTIRRVTDFIEARLESEITLDALAALVDLSPYHFARCFKHSTGLAPHQYVLARRIDLAKRRVVTTRMPVQEIGWSVGLENISHFRRQFAAQIGVVPGELRRAIEAGA